MTVAFAKHRKTAKSPIMTGSATYLDAVEVRLTLDFAVCSRQARRTHYALSAESTLDDDQLLSLVQRAVKHTPTAFNSQSARAVLVLGDKHHQLWDAVFDGYKETLGGDGRRGDKTRSTQLTKQLAG